MAQNFEYPMFSPNERAKLYKRLTNDMPIEIRNGEKITVQDNRYVYIGKFRWIDATQKNENEYQPVDGLIVPNGYATIKTNSLMKFENGDMVVLDGELWTVDGETQIDYTYTPKKVQTYQYLEIKKVK